MRLLGNVTRVRNYIRAENAAGLEALIIAVVKRVASILAVLLCIACSKDDEKPLSVEGEKLYTVRGVILSRNTADNSLNVDHEAIPGFMEAMVMDYNVRGADVATLPPDKSRIEAKLHVTDRAYWITEVKRIE